jgi:hypothetical protein
MNGLETPSPYSEKNYAGARDKKMVEVDSVVVDSVDHKGFHANKTNGDNFSEIGEFKWNDYKKHIVSLKPGLKGKRKLEDIVAINKITRYYKKYLLEQKNEVTSDPSLVGLTNIIKHQQYLDSEDYSWEDLEDDLPSMLEFLQDGINKQSHFFDFEMLDHSLFQKLFPLQVIIDYLKEVNRSFGQEIYNIVLKFQTCLTEIFLWHHFNADTRFHPRVSTGDINISDPFLRIRIREQNQKDVKFNQKYFNVFFNLKKFAYMLLDLFFPNVTRRYISMGQEMHRLSLLLILQMFELGLFSVHEMQDLVNVLLQKFENLFVLEKESYIEFEKSGKVPEEEVRYLKQYFYDCKHIVAGICIQIAVLLNDQAFMDSYPLFNKNLKMTDAAVRKDAWKKAYFSNSIVGNILNRIMTSYLFRFRERIDANSGDLETLFNQINDFVMLTMDIENDVFFVSSKVVNQSLINFYHEAPLDEDVSKADHLSKALIALLDKIMLEEILDKTSVEQEATECLQNYLDTILGFQEGRKREFFKNLLGFRYLPNILLSLQCALITLEAKKETELLCGKALTETCKDSPINQIFSMNKNAVAHWDIIYKRKKLRAVCLQTGLFAGNFHIFYVHRSRLKKFLKYFRKSIDPKWNTLEDSPDAHNQWFSSLKKEVVEENRFESLDILLRFYVNCRFLYDLINDTDHNYMRKFHNQSIQQVLAPPLFKVFLKIVEDPDFLPRSNEFWGKNPRL